jgi:hypothetical protein
MKADPVLIEREGFLTHRTGVTRMGRAPDLARLLTSIHGRLRLGVVHSFYNSGLEDAALWGVRHNVPTLLTICGGRARSTHILPLPHIIVLQEELAQDFQRKNYEKTTVHVIGARVDVPHVLDTVSRLTSEQVEAFRCKHQTGDRKILLRVARVHPDYERSLIEGAFAVEKLTAEGYDLQFVHIGNIQDHESFRRVDAVFRQINQSAGRPLAVSDQEVTSDAAQYLKTAFASLASGRYVFESALAKRPVVVSGRKGTVGLLGPNTASDLRYDNFTGRHLPVTKSQDKSVSDLVDAMRLLLDDTYAYRKAVDFSYTFIVEGYSVSLATEQYEAIYRELISSRATLNRFGILRHLGRSLPQRLQRSLPTTIRSSFRRIRKSYSRK